MKSIIALTALTLATCATQAQTNEAAAETSSGSSLQLDTRSDAERIEFLLNVANVYFAEDDFESAVGAYERILEIDPQHQQARYIIAHVYINAKQYQKAEDLLLELADENPDDFKLLNNLAWLYATAEDPKFRDGKKAVEIAQEAMVMAPNDHHVWSTLSEAYYISGEYEKAYRAIEHMAKLAMRYGQGVTKEQVDEYNNQIRKCKRAWDAEKMFSDEEEEK